MGGVFLWHLPTGATINDYNRLVARVLRNADSLVYWYGSGTADYYAVSGGSGGRVWLIIFGGDGIMETAFPPMDPASYLSRRGFVRLGRVGEIAGE